MHLDQRPPHTHLLKLLGGLISPHNPKLGKLIVSANNLSAYSVAYRYPDAGKKPLTFKAAKASVIKAQKIYDACFKAVYEQK